MVLIIISGKSNEKLGKRFKNRKIIEKEYKKEVIKRVE